MNNFGVGGHLFALIKKIERQIDLTNRMTFLLYNITLLFFLFLKRKKDCEVIHSNKPFLACKLNSWLKRVKAGLGFFQNKLKGYLNASWLDSGVFL